MYKNEKHYRRDAFMSGSDLFKIGGGIVLYLLGFIVLLPILYFTFSTIGSAIKKKLTQVTQISNDYARDGKSIYYGCYDTSGSYRCEKMEEADYSTFTVLKDSAGLGTEFAKDKDSVFYYGKVVNNADPSTFQVIGSKGRLGTHSYSRDAKAIYFGTEQIPGADPANWELLTFKYSKDRNSVFFGTQKLHNTDPNTFEVIDLLFAKDQKSVYYLGGRIKNIHPSENPSVWKSWHLATSEFIFNNPYVKDDEYPQAADFSNQELEFIKAPKN